MYLGVDVGFSTQVRSTGICVIEPSEKVPVRCAHVRTHETFGAMDDLLARKHPVAVAIDGPLVPVGSPCASFTEVNRYRNCERLLSGGIFQKRCKPGPTNSPRGLALHRQATLIANKLMRQFPGTVIAEAFPNAFLGVMLSDDAFQSPIRRGIKSDVFWDHCVRRTSVMRRLLGHLFAERAARRIFEQIAPLENHDERAAVICAIVARGAEMKANLLVGDHADGAISLPPHRFIKGWARKVLMNRVANYSPSGSFPS